MQITVFAMLALQLLVKIMLEKQEKNFKVHIEKIFQKVALTNGKHAVADHTSEVAYRSYTTDLWSYTRVRPGCHEDNPTTTLCLRTYISYNCSSVKHNDFKHFKKIFRPSYSQERGLGKWFYRELIGQ